jgi:DNA (cytosine-5)-methyltransferase 1
MGSYYNEIDPFAAEWLRELIRAGLLPQGDVDARSIVDVEPGDLRGYEQCHFFAGIGGWPYALGLAGFEGECWTGSCPCQPFSVAGAGKGTADERHLWPAFRRLISECRPSVVFGEQVASKDGRLWLAGVRADLEACGYGVGAADLAAASVGAPHIRQRLYWVADDDNDGPHRTGGVAAFEGSDEQDGRVHRGSAGGDANGGLVDSERERGCCGDACGEHAADALAPGAASWSRFGIVRCGDGKARRVPSQPAFQPLAPGLSAGRVGILRGAGNAIVPPLAAEFVMAFRDTKETRIATGLGEGVL